jgi:hypothetical protein
MKIAYILLRHHYEQVRLQLKYLQNAYILEVQRYPKYGTVKTETERVLVVCACTEEEANYAFVP